MTQLCVFAVEPVQVHGWAVHVSEVLRREHPDHTDRALELLATQLAEIVRVLPAPAVADLREVPLWFSPEYPGTSPRAEYHPDANWLRENGRDPLMAKSVEFTNILIFETEMSRMPNFALHELAHAYHHRVLRMGFANPLLRTAYQKAKDGGTYDLVERWNGSGRKNTKEPAYALVNPQEYFAETTEAFFTRNDFYPFVREELQKHDPAMFELLGQLWGMRIP